MHVHTYTQNMRPFPLLCILNVHFSLLCYRYTSRTNCRGELSCYGQYIWSGHPVLIELKSAHETSTVVHNCMCFCGSCLYGGSIYNSFKKYFVPMVRRQKDETLVLTTGFFFFLVSSEDRCWKFFYFIYLFIVS